MTGMIGLQTTQAARLDRALESAVILNWDALMPQSDAGLIHLEYQTGADGALDFFTVWESTVWGRWNLICEFWMRSLWSHATGLSFSNDYHCEPLARALKSVMEHEGLYRKLPNRHGLIQIYPPTPEKRSAAQSWSIAVLNGQSNSFAGMNAAA